jgi:tetratricopeptide (TPR) repeat protein
LFERTLVKSRLALGWPLVSALAVGLLQHVEENDDRALFELELVRDIALRHAGISAQIAWPDDEELLPYSPEVRLTILAQAVQSVADSRWAEAAEYAARARRTVGASRQPEALKLLGAAGRALAAVGDHDAAVEVLQTALDGWLATAPHAGAYALSELLRIEGIRGDIGRVSALRETAETSIVPTLDADSKPYVTLAVGRALVQTGRANEALEILGGEGVGSHAPRHVQTAAQRWRAVAARSVHAGAELADALARLDAFGDSDQRILAQLDSEALDVHETKTCLDALLALPSDGDEARRLLSRLAPGLSTRAVSELPEVVRRLRAEYRY